MTIADAARRALRNLGAPASIQAIQREIEAKGLFTFKAKDPRGVVSSAVRKKSEGSARLSGDAWFRKVGPATYDLV